jgi:hypothetical protein
MNTWLLLATSCLLQVSPMPTADGTSVLVERSNLTAAIPADKDAVEDFWFQGEYLGAVRAVDGRSVQLGLQLVALGDGQFSATGYQDGLPGNGWDRETIIDWTGQRQGDQLTLSGNRGTVVLDLEGGRVIDVTGQEVGTVRRVRRTSRTSGATPPDDAIVLFNGSSIDRFEAGKITDEGWLAPGAMTKIPVRDFRLHLEFQTPFLPEARGQARGNSGVYIQRRYEVQILDSFGLPPVIDGCAALYRQQLPQLNMSFPPLSWQTYDIYFTAARWDPEGRKTSDATITVFHNGVPVHRQQPIGKPTGAGQPETPYDGPLLLQDHGDLVQFRNVWLVPDAQLAALQATPTPATNGETVCTDRACTSPPRFGHSRASSRCADDWWLWTNKP